MVHRPYKKNHLFPRYRVVWKSYLTRERSCVASSLRFAPRRSQLLFRKKIPSNAYKGLLYNPLMPLTFYWLSSYPKHASLTPLSVPWLPSLDHKLWSLPFSLRARQAADSPTSKIPQEESFYVARTPWIDSHLRKLPSPIIPPLPPPLRKFPR